MDLRACYQQMGGDYDAVMARLRQEERVSKFLRMFLADENFQSLTGAMDSQDWPTAFRAAHSLKGVALNLGMTTLAASASALTECLRSGTPTQEPGPLYQAVEADYRCAVAAIHALMAGANG